MVHPGSPRSAPYVLYSSQPAEDPSPTTMIGEEPKQSHSTATKSSTEVPVPPLPSHLISARRIAGGVYSGCISDLPSDFPVFCLGNWSFGLVRWKMIQKTSPAGNFGELTWGQKANPA
ncbi:hypothetical protein BDW74DRAFT_154027 [Aspergillus multicolor]|uniref:uncharacterized protein n=1 Tax=Aspergillus multicolor TaxID=41759 RepID=UPI003CCE01E4